VSIRAAMVGMLLATRASAGARPDHKTYKHMDLGLDHDHKHVAFGRRAREGTLRESKVGSLHVRKVKHRHPLTTVPLGDATPDEIRLWCAEWGIQQSHPEFEGFLLRHAGAETMWRDWGMCWKHWLRKAKEFASRRQPTYQPVEKPYRTMSETRGRPKDQTCPVPPPADLMTLFGEVPATKPRS
jgi:hypothetical protein